jgi:hypothetical protein
MATGLGVSGARSSTAGWADQASGAERRRGAAGFFLAAFFLADFLVGFFLAAASRAPCLRAGALAPRFFALRRTAFADFCTVFFTVRAPRFLLRAVPDLLCAAFFAAGFLRAAFFALAITFAPLCPGD